MVASSSLTNAPVTLCLLLSCVLGSIAFSILDLKHYLPIQPTPHLWPYLQFWRVPTYQFSYQNSSELLFAAAATYRLRVLERMWGSRKFVSCVLGLYAITSAVSVAMVLVLAVVTGGRYNYLPSGSTGMAIALVAVWNGEVPRLGGFKVLLEDVQVGENGEIRLNGGSRQPWMLSVSDKWTVYVLVAQLALSQFPYSLVPAVSGWVVGRAWSEDVLPEAVTRWRVPKWVIGQGSRKVDQGQEEGFEGLSRRMATEGMGGGEGLSSATQDRNTGTSTSRLGRVGPYFEPDE